MYDQNYDDDNVMQWIDDDPQPVPYYQPPFYMMPPQDAQPKKYKAPKHDPVWMQIRITKRYVNNTLIMETCDFGHRIGVYSEVPPDANNIITYDAFNAYMCVNKRNYFELHIAK